jgi:RNA-directed DNA polymerase
VTRTDYDRLKAVLHDAVHRGPAAANRSDVDQFRSHLLGRISWIEAGNPTRGAKLRAQFARITW